MAERLNRTLVESARSMLLDANLSKHYWAEAVSTATYLKNRCPTKAVQEKTPYEAWNGEKPKVCNLRAFRCYAYAHIPKDERGKFDTKARKYVETKGYRLYVTKRKTFYSRDVQFDETPNDGEETEAETVNNFRLSIYQVNPKLNLKRKMNNPTPKTLMSHLEDLAERESSLFTMEGSKATSQLKHLQHSLKQMLAETRLNGR